MLDEYFIRRSICSVDNVSIYFDRSLYVRIQYKHNRTYLLNEIKTINLNIPRKILSFCR